jgi:hypothetical protein
MRGNGIAGFTLPEPGRGFERDRTGRFRRPDDPQEFSPWTIARQAIWRFAPPPVLSEQWLQPVTN